MLLSEFFKQNPEVAIAFSGGVDSSYLLCAAQKNASRVRAYYVKSAFQPEFELADARRLAAQIGADLAVIEADVLGCEEVVANLPNRCYYCKKQIFAKITEAAARDGFSVICDGTNASDDASDRPGMRALREMCVRSPLRECGLTKEEIRRLSREAGLFTWNKPAYACLATRIPSGMTITSERLAATEKAENYLFSLGFTDFRVRMTQTGAKIQVPEAQIARVIEKRTEILRELKPYYADVVLDLEVRG